MCITVCSLCLQTFAVISFLVTNMCQCFLLSLWDFYPHTLIGMLGIYHCMFVCPSATIAPSGLRGCKNSAHSVSRPEVVKGVANQGTDCFVSYGSFFSVSRLCFWCMYCCVWLFLVVSTSAIDCLERLVSEMTYYVSSGTLNPTLTHSLHNNSVTDISGVGWRMSMKFCGMGCVGGYQVISCFGQLWPRG